MAHGPDPLSCNTNSVIQHHCGAHSNDMPRTTNENSTAATRPAVGFWLIYLANLAMWPETSTHWTMTLFGLLMSVRVTNLEE